MNETKTHPGASLQQPGSASYPLFKHMSDTYQLTLVEDELQEIIAKADESRMKANGRADMVRWALVNALYHLDNEQLHELGEAIAKRSGGTYTPNEKAHRPERAGGDVEMQNRAESARSGSVQRPC